jgi:Zn-dependent protease
MASQPAFRLFGFPVHVRAGFFLFMLVVVVANGAPLGVYLAVFMAGLTLLHELGHALAARAAGCRAEISLDFLVGYAAFVPSRPLLRRERAWISLAGPGIQIVVSVGALLLMGVDVFGMNPLHPHFHGSDVKLALWIAGPLIGLFNLLPVLPLDGGNIVLAGLEAIVPRQSRAVMLYVSLVITIGGGLLLLNTSFGPWVIYAAIFPLMSQLQMLRALGQSKRPSALTAPAIAESAAWRQQDLSHMVPGQVPSPWYRANQYLTADDPIGARDMLLHSFREDGAPRWMPPDAADERSLEALVNLLPRPLPVGNPHAEHVLAGILLRLGEYDTAAHYAADSYRRNASPSSALAVARAAAALQDKPTALGWLRAAEGLATPVWINQALQHAPELARLDGV